MTEPGEPKPAEAAALWRRFRVLESAALPLPEAGEPAALELAAYAEGRLDETAAERVEAWLAVHPERLDDLAAARSAGDEIVPPEVIDRAAALVSGDPPGAQIVPFRRRPVVHAAWRMHVARAAVAACLVLTGLVGFTLGAGAYGNLFPSSESVSGDLLDQPSGFFSGEDSAI